MKSNFVLFLSLFFFLSSLSAQDKVVVKATIKQAEPLELETSGDPETIGDISKFEVKGGTAPYSEYTWTEDASEPGKTHQVSLTDAHNCSVSIYVNVTNFSDIEDIAFDSNAYPNPTSDVVNVPIPAHVESVVVSIINAEGLVLYQNTITSPGDVFPLSLATCPTGRYFIRVVSAHHAKTYSIIKQ